MGRTLAQVWHHFGHDEERYLRALEADGRRWDPECVSCDVCGRGDAREHLVSDHHPSLVERSHLCEECVAGARGHGLVVERVTTVHRSSSLA